MTDVAYVDAMRVSQAKIHLGDVRWYVQTANGFIVRGPYDKGDEALSALAQLRQEAREEAAEEDEAMKDYPKGAE